MLKNTIKYLSWILSGRPVPADGDIKRMILRKYADTYKLRTFVETGTFNGDTVAAMLGRFTTIHTVELSPELYRRAKKRFEHEKSVTLWKGDSGAVIQKILKKLKRPALFWLDAHGSGGITAQGEEWSPVIKEVSLIAEHGKKHVILIDDARGFTGHLSPTISQIEEAVSARHTKYEFDVIDDIIRIILA